MEIFTDSLHKIAYSTDASVYREIPQAVAYPETTDDIRTLLQMAKERGTHLIPRAAGTSIAGQVVGSGIVVDISRNWNHILEINAEERWARVQPGVVRDELNIALRPYGLFFSPETSTSNRCCIGGMFGNNSCGTHSLVYGSTRQHVVEATVVLTDGSVETLREVTIGELEERFGQRFWQRKEHGSLIERIYAQLIGWFTDEATMQLIEENYPDRSLTRRSCGYAIDETFKKEKVEGGSTKVEGRCVAARVGSKKDDVLQPSTLNLQTSSLNLCRLLAGSEGTLAFTTEMKVSLDPLPPRELMAVCAHCDTVEKSFEANLVALQHHPTAVEMMDRAILELSRGNVEQEKNRFFVSGNPAAILVVELRAETREELEAQASSLEKHLIESGLVYGCTRAYGKDVQRVWALRKAGLGILNGMKGDAKPHGVVEDTAVAPKRLPEYLKDFREMATRLGADIVYYGHISTGELHLRPIINLKTAEGRKLFRDIARETTLLVKKHRGTISGEHGDGRLRGEFIPLLYGEETFELMRQLKRCWDPDGLLNMHKIVDTLPMDEMLRSLSPDPSPKGEGSEYLQAQNMATKHTTPLSLWGGGGGEAFNWKAAFDECTLPGATGATSQWHALICSIEQCNGAGDCRKSNLIGGTMCPAYKVSGDELMTTRARANVLREILTRGYDSEAFNTAHPSPAGGDLQSAGGDLQSPTHHPSPLASLKEILSSCLACKGCRRECPSNVDMTRLRAEVLQLIYDNEGTPLRSWLVARMALIEQLGSYVRPLYNFFATWQPSARLIKKIIQFAPEREIPRISRLSMRRMIFEGGSTMVEGRCVAARVGSKKDDVHQTSTLNLQTSEGTHRPSTFNHQPSKVYLFADEFTDHQEAELGLHFAQLLQRLGYEVVIPRHVESGRAAISKGCLKRAKRLAQKNVQLMKDIVSEDAPLVGIEPSCILSFRDEYPDLVPPEMRQEAIRLGKNSLLYDEFLLRETEAGRITPEMFDATEMEIFLHGHCHQKALLGVEKTAEVLRRLLHAQVNVIPSGCCGMAGSFGYEKEHYKTSLAIGEMVLFPAVRKAMEGRRQESPDNDEAMQQLGTKPVVIAAPGTSCRQQIKDGTGFTAVHPIEILLKFKN